MERHFFNKMMFFCVIHKLKGAPQETRRQLAARTEKTFIEREMDILQFTTFKEDIFTLQNSLAELKAEH